MNKIGFVIPWFGWDIPGGAEAELRGLVTHLHDAGVNLEILTTCVKEFLSDWSCNFYRYGISVERGITIRRFRADARNVIDFAQVNAKLMEGRSSLTDEEEQIYVREMINSRELYRYLAEHQQEYSLYVFIPYMFGTTYYGIQQCPEKSVLIPCLHDESYIYMKVFAAVFSQLRGMIFHAHPEEELAERVYDLSQVSHAVLGEGIDTDWKGDEKRFRKKYQMSKPFILYAGRKDSGKNVDRLIAFYREYTVRNEEPPELVLIGGGSVRIPEDIKDHIHDLGYVSIQDKYDAYTAAEILCNPSHNESFSLVVMESWIAQRPVLVSGSCAVTKDFVLRTGGGLYFDSYFEFEGALNYLRRYPDIADRMGKCGKKYVLDNFSWPVIVERYISFFAGLCQERVQADYKH